MTLTRRIIGTALFLLAALGMSAQQQRNIVSSKTLYTKFQNPSNNCRPFVRWWWNGDAVEAEELKRELHVLHAAGIGGVEINPISLPYGADRHGHRTLKWLSDEWIDMLQVVFDEAKRLGMTCDLLIGSGWPFGAETLPLEERASVMLTASISLRSGERAEISQFDIFKQVDPGVSVVNHGRTPHLIAAYLVSDPIESLQDAKEVTQDFKDGVLTLDVPAKGAYRLYALVQFESFASVINGAPGAAGSILDHMNATAVRGYLERTANTIEAKTGPLRQHLRSFFVDSMELEGTNWTSDFREEFRKRRGYDIMPWLPFTMFKVGRLGEVTDYNFGSKKGDAFKNQVDRVRYDFELTKAELLMERYTHVYTSWCKEKGVKSRQQSYGRGFFIQEPSLYCDIPEGESWTTNWLRHRLGEEMPDSDYRKGRGYTMIDKYVSSAAHQTGKRFVSCEEMTNTYLVFNTPLELLKIGTDMSAFSGVTHSVWHGFNYMPQDVAFPGWVQYGSYYNENNTWFPYWHLLNEYRARMTSMFLQMDMCTDIALLPANCDLWTELGVQTEPFPSVLNVPYTSLIWEAIHKTGGGADYVSEQIIEKATVKDGYLCYGPKRYRDLFLIEVKGTTQATLDKLLAFVRGGGRVFCIGTYPIRSLGLKDYEARDAQLHATVEQLKRYPDRFILLQKPENNQYLEWYARIMEQYQLPHAITITQPDRFLLQNHYVADDKSDVFLFANVSLTEDKATDIIFPKALTKGRQAWLYDPADGKRYRLPMEGQQLHLSLSPAECFFVVLNREKGGKLYQPIPTTGSDALTPTHWQVRLHHKKEGWDKTIAMDSLKDLKDTEFVNFMGDATYTTTLHLEEGRLPRFLNLGKACEIAEVTVNGKSAGVKWFGRKLFDVSGLLHKGDNTLEIKVTTLMGNYMQTLKDNKVAQRYVLKRKHPLRSMGLLGPVTLYR